MMARLAALLVLAAACIGASGQLVIEDAKRQVRSPGPCERHRLFAGGPRRSPRPPPRPQIDISDFVVHEQLQLSVRNDGRDAAPSLLLCDRNLARAAYLEVGKRMPAAIAGLRLPRRGWRREPPPAAGALLAPPLPQRRCACQPRVQVKEADAAKDANAPKLQWKVAAPAGAPAGVACREYTLPKPLAKKGSVKLTAFAAYTHVLRPEPAEVRCG